jgi:hypothetical protein
MRTLRNTFGKLDLMVSFAKDNLITEKMAYGNCSYEVEKAWCNTTVQETIRQNRASDKSKNASTDPAYGDFERLAKEYLANEGQSCSDMDKQ